MTPLRHDAFTHKLTTQTSLAFEKAAVIFQIAATLSSLSQAQHRSSPEGLKRAYHFARASAGMLVYINENFLHAPSTDLSKEVVKYLVGLMLAQAQEMFTEKVLEEGKTKKGGNGAMVARLAAQASFLYATLAEDVKEFFGKGIIDRSWVGVINTKERYLRSLSLYHKSVADDATSKHGDALVRLALAETAAREAHRLATTFASAFVSTASPTLPSDAATSLVDLTKTHLALVSERKQQATRDNDLIYHAIVPSEAALPTIENLPAATPIPIQETYSGPEVSKLIGPDIFHRLVPLSVHESASVYSEEKAKLARAEVEKSDAAEGDVRAALESLGLPAGLNKFKQMAAGGGLGGLDALAIPSKEVMAWSEQVQEDNESGEGTERLLARLDESRRKAGNEIEWVQGQLDDESRECERMRVSHYRVAHVVASHHCHLTHSSSVLTQAKMQGNWSQPPSAALTKTQRDDLRSQRTALQTAAQSDARVLSLHQSIPASTLAILRTTDNLGAAFAEAVAGKELSSQAANLLDLDVVLEERSEKDGEQIKKLVGEIEERLGRLSRLKRERAGSVKDLKELIQTDDVSQLLLLNRRTNGVEPSLFATELEKFRPFQNRLNAAVEHERTTLQEITDTLDRLTAHPGARETQAKWDGAQRRVRELSSKLGRAMVDYQEVRSGLRRGLEFYDQLAGMTATLRQSVKSFVTTRTEERNRLAGSSSSSPPPSRGPPGPSLESQFGSLGMGGGSRSPTSQTSPSPYADWRSSASPPPAPPPSQSYGAYPAPPAPMRAGSTSTSSPAPPPPPPSNPWDFGSVGLSSAFQTQPPPPQQPQHHYQQPPPPHSPCSPPPSSHQPSYPGPPPQRQPSYPGSPPPPPPTHSPYGAAAPSPSTYQPQHQPYLPPPPPPSSYGGYSSPPPLSNPAYPPPPSSSSSFYPKPPPPPGQHAYGQQPQHSPYGAPPPPPPQHQQGGSYGGGYGQQPYGR